MRPFDDDTGRTPPRSLDDLRNILLLAQKLPQNLQFAPRQSLASTRPGIHRVEVDPTIRAIDSSHHVCTFCVGKLESLGDLRRHPAGFTIGRPSGDEHGIDRRVAFISDDPMAGFSQTIGVAPEPGR